MDPLSLSALGAVGLTYAVKFIFDRANAALDRRAQRKDNATTNVPSESDSADNPNARSEDAATPQDIAELAISLRELEPYRAPSAILTPEDTRLLEALERTRRALERVEGTPLDIVAITRSAVRIDQHAEDVRGSMVGADTDSRDRDKSFEITQRVRSIHSDGDVTGYRSGNQ